MTPRARCAQIMLPVAIAFCAYSLIIYRSRTRMLQERAPGPYEDVVGPSLLGVTLLFGILGNFMLKLFHMSR